MIYLNKINFVLAFTILLSCSFGNSASADTNGDFEKAKKTWNEFRACGQIKGAALEKCLERTLGPKLDPWQKQKMSEYILMGFKFSDLRVCEERDSLVPVKTKNPPTYFCLSVLGHRSRTQGYATFQPYKSELRLTSVRYDF